jgi:Legume lectin domain
MRFTRLALRTLVLSVALFGPLRPAPAAEPTITALTQPQQTGPALFSARINFQLAGAATPAEYLADTGAAYGSRGNGYTYGWSGDNRANARERSAIDDQRYDTLLHMQKPENPNAVWELSVPNGTYQVHIVSGDPSHTDSVYRINVEGVLAISGTPTSARRWFENTVTVTVSDGRLTVSNATGASNNKINFLDITPVTLPGLDFSGGFTAAAGLTANGSAAYTDGRLRLTNGGNNEAGSAFSNTPFSVKKFTTQFDFQLSNPNADGITFTLQGIGPLALGPAGGGLGFGPDNTAGTGGIARSVAVKFDLYNNQGEGINSTGVFTNGAAPTVGGVAPAVGSTNLTGTGLDLHSGHVFRARLSYNGSTLVVTLTDLTTGASASQAYLINIPGIIGSDTAYVGFTGGTGGLTATQDVLNWVFTPLW